MQKQITLTIEQARAMLGKDIAMDQLIRANFSEDELKPKPVLPKRWEDLETVDGWYVDEVSEARDFYGTTRDVNKNTYATKQQALSFGIIYPQLTQLMKVYRGGWEPDWSNRLQMKYGVIMEDVGLTIRLNKRIPQPITFQAEALAKQFLTDHRDLILEFYKGM